MDIAPATTNFADKWHARWPEWNVAVVFLPAAQRASTFAWFALLQELTDAAWAGDDATPGLAKLAWWNEELQGWAKGARRHPLGETLQARPAPWTSLAAALRGLQASRELPATLEPAQSGLEAFAQAVWQCEQRLLVMDDANANANADPDADAGIMFDLLAERRLLQGDVEGGRALLTAWPEQASGPRARRVQSAFMRQRLRHLADGAANRPPAPWRSLWLAWRAAR